METSKAWQRRMREGFFEKYLQGRGIDIGCGDDPVTPDCIQWDRQGPPYAIGPPMYINEEEILANLRPGRIFSCPPAPTMIVNDAMSLAIESESLPWVYSSHCLEDLDNPWAAVKEWWRVIKRGGYLVIMVPHRDLFECRKTLPSAGNRNHKTFWLPDRNEPPVTIGLIPLVAGVCQESSELVYCKVCDEGYNVTFGPFPGEPNCIQPVATGEFSIEAVWKKAEPRIYTENMLLPEWFSPPGETGESTRGIEREQERKEEEAVVARTKTMLNKNCKIVYHRGVTHPGLCACGYESYSDIDLERHVGNWPELEGKK
jgi:SAM-dependent methyltransferase